MHRNPFPATPTALGLCLGAALTFALPVAAQHAPEPAADAALPSPRDLTSQQWQADVRFLAEAIRERHPRPFHTMSPEAFAAAAERLEARIPELGYEQILAEISRLVAMLGEGDGHSRVRFTPRFIDGQYPVRFWLFADGLFLRSAAPDHARLAGKRVVSLGGRPTDEALALLAAIVPADNEFNRKLKIAAYLLMPELLQGLGLAGTGGRLPLELEGSDGVRIRAELDPVPWPPSFHHTIGNLVSAPQRLGAPEEWADMRPVGVPQPWALGRLQDWYWMEALDDGRALYVQLNAIGNQEGKESMEEFFVRVFARAEDEAVEKLILDVRYNGGGNNFFNRHVIHSLIRSDKMNRRGRTYVLIGRTTFSAAQNLITKLDGETEVVFVGEPSGGKPNHYGDARRVTLPESRLDVSISSLYWQDGGPFDDGPWEAPHLAVDTTSSDWAAGRDPVLDVALAVEPATVGTPFAELLTSTFQSDGFEATLEAYQAYKDDPAHRYVHTERTMNSVGYYLLQNDRVEQAIQVFELNVEAYPDSWNTHDSLGESLAAAGHLDKAIASYQRSLELNPENRAGARALERLRAQDR